MYYDKDGQPIDLKKWGELWEDFSYRLIQQDKVNGKFISTVWLGSNHRFIGEGAPLIFETMVFPDDEDNWEEEEMYRYATEAEAKATHQMLLEKYS